MTHKCTILTISLTPVLLNMFRVVSSVFLLGCVSALSVSSYAIGSVFDVLLQLTDLPTHSLY